MLKMNKINLHNQDGSLCSEAQLLLSSRPDEMSLAEWRKRIKDFKFQLSTEDLKEFEKIRKKKLQSEYRILKQRDAKRKEQELIANTKKINLYNQDGSLCSEAQFLMSFKSSNMSMKDWKKRMKAFKSQLSAEDLKEFERLKIYVTSAEWYAENIEKAKENNAKWYVENVKKQKQTNAKWYAENPEKVKQDSAKWRAKNPEKIKEHQRKQRSTPHGKLRKAVYSALKNTPKQTNGHSHSSRLHLGRSESSHGESFSRRNDLGKPRRMAHRSHPSCCFFQGS